jgi:hypothetical protein
MHHLCELMWAQGYPNTLLGSSFLCETSDEVLAGSLIFCFSFFQIRPLIGKDFNLGQVLAGSLIFLLFFLSDKTVDCKRF